MYRLFSLFIVCIFIFGCTSSLSYQKAYDTCQDSDDVLLCYKDSGIKYLNPKICDEDNFPLENRELRAECLLSIAEQLKDNSFCDDKDFVEPKGEEIDRDVCLQKIGEDKRANCGNIDGPCCYGGFCKDQFFVCDDYFRCSEVVEG